MICFYCGQHILDEEGGAARDYHGAIVQLHGRCAASFDNDEELEQITAQPSEQGVYCENPDHDPIED